MIVRILLYSVIFYSIWWITNLILTKLFKAMLNVKDEIVYLDVFKCPPYLLMIKMPAPEKIVYLTIFSYYRKIVGFTFTNEQIADWGGLQIDEVQPALDSLIEKGYINSVEIDGDRIITLVKWGHIPGNKVSGEFIEQEEKAPQPRKPRGRPKKNSISL